jgi:glycolate oxidase
MNPSVKAKLLRLKKSLPGEISLEPAKLAQYAGDKWFATHQPDAVALPRSVASVSKILRFANEHKIPVTARGAGYGYVGGCVPIRGGIALSTERMNRILEINQGDFVAVVQPAVITAEFQAQVEKRKLFYPPDPASRADNFIGGNIATNAGGPRCLKYGVTREYVLGLQVVLADGTFIRTGGRNHKNKTGFDLTKLFVGSEGLLGVITEATLKLIPLPPYRVTMAIGFNSMHNAVGALQAILHAGFLPSALELADRFTLAAAAKYTGNNRLGVCKAHLIVELDGQKKSVRGELPAVERVVRRFLPLLVEHGYGDAECEKIWQVRRVFSMSLKSTGLKKLNEDIVVPRGRLEDLFRFTARLQKKIKLPIACFGHAGDGNIHVNIMLDQSDAAAVKRGEAALDDLFHQVIAWNGAITGEHGIGLAKKRWWPLAVSPEVRELHHSLKHLLDPNGILNPGKFVES